MECGCAAVPESIIMYLVLIISVIVLVLLWVVVRGRRTQIHDVTSAQAALVPVDLDAFRNLIDRQQERFLREHLSAPEFRRLQRARNLAVIEYLWRVAHNAGVVLQLGMLARDREESPVRTEGIELMSAAAELRLNCLCALGRALVGVFLPKFSVSLVSLADSYDRVTLRFWEIGRCWKPARMLG